MPLAKCVRCEKLFDKKDKSVCPACQPDEETDYELVRECLAENPDFSAEAVAEATGVSVNCVSRMIDEGLIVNTAALGEIKCGRCGAPAISASKKLCHGCLEKMNQNVAKQRTQLELARKKSVQIGEYAGVRETIEAKRKL